MFQEWHDSVFVQYLSVFTGVPLDQLAPGRWSALYDRPELSERELQVLQYMALGRSNKEIGQVLYISENTVKGHVKSILTKLDAIGRTEAIAIANRRGIIQTS